MSQRVWSASYKKQQKTRTAGKESRSGRERRHSCPSSASNYEQNKRNFQFDNESRNNDNINRT